MSSFRMETLVDELFLKYGDAVKLFTVDDVLAEYPHLTYHQIWRALKILEDEDRLKVALFKDKRKYYIGTGATRLPLLKFGGDRVYPCSVLVKELSSVYTTTDKPVWSVLLGRVNKVPALIGQLFISAKEETPKARQAQLIATLKQLVEAKNDLTKAIGFIDAILSDQAIKSPERFHEVFTGDREVPNDEQMTEFIVWVGENFSESS